MSMSINALSSPKIGFSSVYQQTSTGWQEIKKDKTSINDELSNSEMENVLKESSLVNAAENVLTGETFIATGKDAKTTDFFDRFPSGDYSNYTFGKEPCLKMVK